MNIKCLVFLFNLSVLALPCLASETSYRTIPFTHTPLYAMRGAQQHSDPSDSTALFHFIEKNGFIQSITYKMNGIFKPNYENYTSSDYVWAAQNYFEYSENNIIVKHYDHLSQPIENNPAISKYTLDQKRRIIGLQYLDKNYQPAERNGIHEYQWQYFNNAVGEIRYSATHEEMPVNNWFPFKWVILTFDESNNLKTLVTTLEQWKTSKEAIQINFFVENSEIIKWQAIDINTNEKAISPGPDVSEVRHDFNENGYLIRTRFFDVSGQRAQSKWGHMGFVRTYSQYGNRLTYNFIDENDEITISSRGYSGQQFFWDNTGRFRVATEYIDIKGVPIFRESSGYSKIQYIYNYQGREIGIIFRDINDNLICNDEVQSSVSLESSQDSWKQHLICES